MGDQQARAAGTGRDLSKVEDPRLSAQPLLQSLSADRREDEEFGDVARVEIGQLTVTTVTPQVASEFEYQPGNP